MTVKELISELEKQDENKQVFIYCTYDGGYLCGGSDVKLKQWEELNDEPTEQTGAIILYNGQC